MRRMRTALVLSTTAAMLITTLGSAARADETGMFNSAFGNCGSFYMQYCTGHGQGMPIGLSTLAVEITCSATSPFVVDRTGVRCYLLGMNDGLTYLDTGEFFVPGNQAVIANAGTVPFQGYWLCVGAGYSTPSGGYSPVTGFDCDL